jgi:aminopeptidase N
MKTLYALLTLVLSVTFAAQAQDKRVSPNKEQFIQREAASFARMQHADGVESDGRYDATYYRLELKITTNPQYVRGVVLMKAKSLQAGLATAILDLTTVLTVDSVKFNGTLTGFTHAANTLTVTLTVPPGLNESFDVTVYYRGVPPSTGFGSFTFDTHGSGQPWVYTLSEPYGARDWWPCKDHPSDKADSADILITCDSTLKAGANGVLVSALNNGDGTKTYHWQERYPITTYLIMLAMSDFAEFTTWFPYAPGDSMPIVHYVLPEHLASAQTAFAQTDEMLDIFSYLFGLYPFVAEKYGHAEFGWGGAMEHQTMTSITYPFAEDVIAHELAHQWFGDMISPARWADIWLNEGFASYCEALYMEQAYGTSEYWSVINTDLNLAKMATGTLYVQDTTSVGSLFNWYRSYKKGSSVLHMLRHVLGDSLFFASMYAYANDPQFRHGTATTPGFRDACEGVSGMDLDYFFNEWVFGESYPRYTYSWISTPTDSGYRVSVHISQATYTSNPTYFTMPVDFKLTASGWDTTVVLFNNAQSQDFVITHLSHAPTSGQLDPNNWILRNTTLVDTEGNPVNPYRFVLHPNYPNPFNAGTTIEYELAEESDVRLTVYNLLGQKVRTLVSTHLWRGSHTTAWDGLDDRGRIVASGVYLYRLEASQRIQTRKMLMLK